MKKCRNCNREIGSDDAKFCPFCGSKLSPPERFCTECGCEIDYSYKYCRRCGNKIGSDDEQSIAFGTGSYDSSLQNEIKNTTITETPISSYIQYDNSSTKKASYTNPHKNESTAGFSYKITVNYRLGKGNTVFSQSMGTLTFTQNEVSFVGSIGSGNNHSYPLSNIAGTEFKVVRLGLSPNPGYVVKLKNGEEKVYIYSPFIKGQLVQADQAIKNLL